MKRSRLVRTPMKRGRKRINQVSEGRKQENVERREVMAVHLKDYCEAHRAGASGECFGKLHGHEVLSRARGGSITDPDNIKTVCDGHNVAISQDVITMRWALANGFLRHAWD